MLAEPHHWPTLARVGQTTYAKDDPNGLRKSLAFRRACATLIVGGRKGRPRKGKNVRDIRG